jgi:hypothetical protein
VEGFGGRLVIDVVELVEGTLEVDPVLEGDRPEEGDRVNLPMAADEPALLGKRCSTSERDSSRSVSWRTVGRSALEFDREVETRTRSLRKSGYERVDFY